MPKNKMSRRRDTAVWSRKNEHNHTNTICSGNLICFNLFFQISGCYLVAICKLKYSNVTKITYITGLLLLHSTQMSRKNRSVCCESCQIK